MTTQAREKRDYEFSNKRTTCPKCGARRGFAPLKDHDGFGYCHSCGVTLFPGMNDAFIPPTHQAKKEKPADVKYITADIINSLPDFESSNLAKYYDSVFSNGFSWHCKNFYDVKGDGYGGVCFIYRNKAGQVCRVKSVPYLENGHRDKQGYRIRFGNDITEFPAVFGVVRGKINGMATVSFFSKDMGYSSNCLFNEFKLHPEYQPFDYDQGVTFNQHTPVIILESEKSVLVLSYFFPEYIWLATGGTNGLTREKAEALRGRRVFVSFDTGAEERQAAAIDVLNDLGIQAKAFNIFDDVQDIPGNYDLADLAELMFKEGRLKL